MNGTILAADQVNLTSGWNTLWSALNIPGPMMTLMTVIGVIIVVGAIVKWLWDRKRMGSAGMGQGASPVLWAAIIGVALAAPNLIIPIFLTIVDWIINGFVSIWQGTGAS